jgi:hypothetical protein
VDAHLFLLSIPADRSRIGDAFALGLQHPFEQFICIFEEATPAKDIALGERKQGGFEVVWGNIWKFGVRTCGAG